MRFSLRTFLISVTMLGIGFGAGIMAEKWRERARRYAFEHELVRTVTVIKKGGRYVGTKTKLVPRGPIDYPYP